MEISEHQIEEIIKAVKNNGDLSIWKKDHPELVALLSQLSSIPKSPAPNFNTWRVRNQILDRISVPQMAEAGLLVKLAAFAPYLRVGAGVMASLLIVVSLTLGTAVVALESVPGSAIYPLKKIVENIELRLTPADQKANIQLKFAGNRADELQEVLEKRQEGKISEEETEAIVANTVKDLQKTAAAALSNSTSKSKSSAIVNKLADISNKLRAASVQSEGQVKIELEKALEVTKITQEEAIKNLEQAGLKVENAPITIDDSIKASGKLTSVDATSISIGTVKFLLKTDTQFVGMAAADLKAGILVDIEGKIEDNKSYAIKITKVAETIIEAQTTDTTEEAPQE